MGRTTELLKTHWDISPTWHEQYPGIIGRFAASFSEPLSIWGGCDDAGQRIILGRVMSVEIDESGMRLSGKVTWTGERPRGYVKMNWARGPGDERVSLTSGYVDAWAHYEDFKWIHEDDDADDEDEWLDSDDAFGWSEF